jgi:hypothetical protein
MENVVGWFMSWCPKNTQDYTVEYRGFNCVCESYQPLEDMEPLLNLSARDRLETEAALLNSGKLKKYGLEVGDCFVVSFEGVKSKKNEYS